MKKPHILLFLAPVALLGLAITLRQAKAESPQAIYESRCQGCHGKALKTFIQRTYKAGQSKEAVATSIRKGIPALGMPAYEKALSEKEIQALAEFILEAQKLNPQPESETFFSRVQTSSHQTFRVESVIEGLDCPWGMAFLSETELLITERSGKLLRLINGSLSAPIEGVPEVFNKGQGGLLDVRLHPKFRENGWIYLSYAHLQNNQGHTAVMRARLKGNRLIEPQIIFKAQPVSDSGVHFGSRIDFDRQGYLFISVGERGKSQDAQDLSKPGGKTHRILDDGRIPPDNPFVGRPGALPSIFTYGHRNPQGLRRHPWRDEIWVHEHGPKGGDEINVLKAGANYGWPIVTHGINYDGTVISKDSSRPGVEAPLHTWVPSIAPCGMAFIDSARYPGWRGHLMVGSLSHTHLRLCQLEDRRVRQEEKLLNGIGRVRDIEISPEGWIHVAIERPGRIIRLVPN